MCIKEGIVFHRLMMLMFLACVNLLVNVGASCIHRLSNFHRFGFLYCHLLLSVLLSVVKSHGINSILQRFCICILP